MAILGVIADDFTGATDIAGMLVKGGMRTIQTIGVPAKGTIPDDVDAVVVALKSRSIAAREAIEQSLAALDTLLKADVDPARVAAIIIEPVQGEGGFYIAPKELMVKLRQLCDQHGILLIADEVQSGFGRTGKLFALEHSGIEADIMTMAKSMADGMPLSAVVGTAEVMDASGPNSLGGTYSGNPGDTAVLTRPGGGAPTNAMVDARYHGLAKCGLLFVFLKS